jgi:hypothetical protein
VPCLISFTGSSHRPLSELQFWCPCWYHIFPIFLHSQIIVIISSPTLFGNFYFNLPLKVTFLLYNCHSLLLRHLFSMYTDRCFLFNSSKRLV